MQTSPLRNGYIPTLNTFTSNLRKLCLEQGTVEVRLMNDDIVEVMWQDATEDGCEASFRTTNWSHVWRVDGVSIKGPRLNISHLIEEECDAEDDEDNY